MKTKRSSFAVLAAFAAAFLGLATTSAEARHPYPTRCHVSPKPVAVRSYPTAALRIGPVVISSGPRYAPVFRPAPAIRTYHHPHVAPRPYTRGPSTCRR